MGIIINISVLVLSLIIGQTGQRENIVFFCSGTLCKTRDWTLNELDSTP